MNCCITELRCKEVIDKSNGCRLGLISDVEVDSCGGRVVALIIYGSSIIFTYTYLFAPTRPVNIKEGGEENE